MIDGLLSPMHLLIILAIALIVLGPKRLPEAGRGLGEAIRGFRESLSAHADEDERPPAAQRAVEPAPPAPAPPAPAPTPPAPAASAPAAAADVRRDPAKD